MKVPGAADLASKSHSGSDLNHVKPKDEVADSYQLDMKVRCPCTSSLVTESMIKCEDPLCQVWQHIVCVIIPEKPMDGVLPEIPPHFYCEICRIKRADPFWVTISHPLLPLKLTSCTADDGISTVQNMDQTFPLSRADREMLQSTEYDIQVWCILLNDAVPFRMQWPQYAELQVNGVSVRTTNRQGSQLLGINGRDDGSVITTSSREGINKICLSRCDARVFCFGIRIAKRRTLQQVLNLVPKEADGERLEDGLTRVRRCIGGGSTKENADDDSDIEVVADSVSVNLRCPMSGSRMKVAGRFRPCAHMGCFDLEAFVELNQRSRKWQCPICLKNYSVENIIIDSYFNRITSMMQNCSEDVNEVDIKPDGSWRAKNESEFKELVRWHLPDGSLCPTSDADIKHDLGVLRLIKQEDTSEGHTGLRLGMKRNRNGMWEVSKHGDVIPMNRSFSYRDVEDPSVNHDGRHFDFTINNGHEHDTFSPSFVRTHNVEDRFSLSPSKDTDVIVLSDTEEDIVTLISPEAVYGTGTASGTGIPFSEDPGLGTSGASCLGLFDNNGDDFGPIWPMQSGPGFQLFATDGDISDVLVAPISSFATSDGGLGVDGSAVQNMSTSSNTETNGSLVDNPLAVASDDPSLQIFLPTRAPSVPLLAGLGSDRTEIPNGDHSDDWISLSLAAGGNHGESVPPRNGLNSRQQFTSKEKMLEVLADTDLLLSMNDVRSKKATTNSQRFDSTSSHPRQPRVSNDFGD